MNIQPRLLSLHDLLKERLFRIPEYQRSYSWRSKQRSDLFADINKISASDESHFMATVVGLRRGTRMILTTEFHDVDVVDGQQRITTLVVLLKAIELRLGSSDPTEQAVAAELRSLLVKADQLAPVLLQTNHDSSQHCVTYLRNGTHADPKSATTVADRCLLEAMAECEHFADAWKSRGELLKLVTLLKNKLKFIFHEIDSESAVYTVFEVLNSRGLDVSWFDRLKSILMGMAFESKTGNEAAVIDELHRLWREIYSHIGLKAGLSAETLKVAASLWFPDKPSRPLGEEQSVETLRTIAGQSPNGVVNVSEWLLKVVQAVNVISSDRRLEGVTQIAQARLLAASVLLRDDLAEQEKQRLLRVWERVSFRIYGMFRRDARSKVGDFVRLAWQVNRERLSVAAIEKGLCDIGSDFPIALAIAELRDSNRYHDWTLELRYLLFRYEEHLSASQNFVNEQWSRIWEANAAESIEHIQPQSKGSHQRSDSGIFVHRLGNLVLLPPRLNSKLQDLDPTEKADAYRKTGLNQAIDVAGRIPTWDRAAVEKREQEILAWAASHWTD